MHAPQPFRMVERAGVKNCRDTVAAADGTVPTSPTAAGPGAGESCSPSQGSSVLALRRDNFAASVDAWLGVTTARPNLKAVVRVEEGGAAAGRRILHKNMGPGGAFPASVVAFLAASDLVPALGVEENRLAVPETGPFHFLRQKAAACLSAEKTAAAAAAAAAGTTVVAENWAATAAAADCPSRGQQC